jgi:hypothetical protein
VPIRNWQGESAAIMGLAPPVARFMPYNDNNMDILPPELIKAGLERMEGALPPGSSSVSGGADRNPCPDCGWLDSSR